MAFSLTDFCFSPWNWGVGMGRLWTGFVISQIPNPRGRLFTIPVFCLWSFSSSRFLFRFLCFLFLRHRFETCSDFLTGFRAFKGLFDFICTAVVFSER